MIQREMSYSCGDACQQEQHDDFKPKTFKTSNNSKPQPTNTTTDTIEDQVADETRSNRGYKPKVEKAYCECRQQIENEAKRQIRRGQQHQEEPNPCRRSWGAPGVLFVPWGPAGPPDRSNSTHHRPQQEAPRTTSSHNLADTAVVQNATADNDDDDQVKECKLFRMTIKNQKRKTWILMILLAFLVLAAVCLGVGVSVLKGKIRNSSGSKIPTMMAAPLTSCDFWKSSNKQPNVVTQCLCAGSIKIVADDVASNYRKLLETGGLIHELHPNFNNNTMDSCNPANQALVWLASGTGTPSSNSRTRQRYILAMLYLIWHGERWTSNRGWFSSLDECSWNGVACDTSGQVVKIVLTNKALHGNLGSEIAWLTSLTTLSVAKNNLQGTLPTEFVNLPYLRELAVDFNALSGSIPSDYGSMKALSSLLVTNNNLIGTLPVELSMLTGLQELRASNNKIMGTIPTQYGLLQNLQSITLANNTLLGKIPTEIGLWTRVELVDLSVNNFQGNTIPTEIGLVSTLISLKMMMSGINGTIPIELFGIGGMQDMELGANNLQGTIPVQIGQMSYLEILHLDQNLLTGTIPSEIGHCSSLRQVFVDSNFLKGTIPSELGLLHLEMLNIMANQFTGSVPAEVCATVTPFYCYQGYKSKLECHCCNCPGGSFS